MSFPMVEKFRGFSVTQAPMEELYSLLSSAVLAKTSTRPGDLWVNLPLCLRQDEWIGKSLYIPRSEASVAFFGAEGMGLIYGDDIDKYYLEIIEVGEERSLRCVVKYQSIIGSRIIEGYLERDRLESILANIK